MHSTERDCSRVMVLLDWRRSVLSESVYRVCVPLRKVGRTMEEGGGGGRAGESTGGGVLQLKNEILQ